MLKHPGGHLHGETGFPIRSATDAQDGYLVVSRVRVHSRGIPHTIHPYTFT